MAVQTVQTVNRSGLQLDTVAVAADAALSDKWIGTGSEFLYINNGGASSLTVTFPIQQTVDGQTVTSRTMTVAAGKHALVGPFPTGVFNDANGYVNVQWSEVSSVTIAVLILGK